MILDRTSYQGETIGVELPVTVDLKVVETEPGFAGDTQTGARKAATLETGLIVQVPIFVDEGDTIRVDTRTGRVPDPGLIGGRDAAVVVGPRRSGRLSRIGPPESERCGTSCRELDRAAPQRVEPPDWALPSWDAIDGPIRSGSRPAESAEPAAAPTPGRPW